MKTLLYLSACVDRLNEWVGRGVSWLVLAAVLISAVNAATRKAFDLSSNGALEIQWYLFSGMFLLAAGYTLLRQEHVKIDILLNRFTRRTQVKVEITAFVCFLMPFVVAVVELAWPLVVRAYDSGEMSSNAGGLIRWPVFALIPLGFGLLGLQGLSEIIKRIAFLKGQAEDPALALDKRKTPEEELAEAIRAKNEAIAGDAR